jgi:hypothetical protein
MTFVEPSERCTPVPATATCITCLAKSAAECSIDWYLAAIPSDAL